MDIILTEHFRLSEFTKSQTAQKLKILNIPTLEQVGNLQQLCIHVLEPLRVHNQGPISVGSGFRCQQLNKAVGGVSSSQHMSGQAADLHIPNFSVGKAWFDWIESHCEFDQLIFERTSKTSSDWWIHVSYVSPLVGKNRKQVIRELIKNK